MGPGELGELVQKIGAAGFLERLTRKEMALRRGRLGRLRVVICTSFGSLEVLGVRIKRRGINKTWRAEGADAGEAAGSASEDRSLFLE